MRFKADTLLEKAVAPVFTIKEKEQELVKAMFGDFSQSLDLEDIASTLNDMLNEYNFLNLDDQAIGYWKDGKEGAAIYAAQVMIIEMSDNKKSLATVLKDQEERDYDEMEGTKGGNWCLLGEDTIGFYEDLYTALSRSEDAKDGYIANIDNIFKLYDNQEIERIAIRAAHSNTEFESIREFTDKVHDRLKRSSRTE